MSPAPNDQSWLATLWDVISSAGITNIATLAGVWVALWLANKSSRERRTERQAEQLTEARLVRVTHAELIPNPQGLGPQFIFSWVVANESGSAITDVRFEVWPLQLTDPPLAKSMPIVKVFNQPEDGTEDSTWTWVDVPGSLSEQPHITAWRMTWRDRHGNHWAIDQPDQVEPRPFKRGALPRPLVL